MRDENVFYYTEEIFYLFMLLQTDMPLYKEGQKL